VITGGEDDDLLVRYEVDDLLVRYEVDEAMLVINSSRPGPRQVIFERFWLPMPLKGSLRMSSMSLLIRASVLRSVLSQDM
jgi:hypothetical protein